MTLAVLPAHNQIAMSMQAALERERRVTKCAVAFHKARLDTLPTVEAVEAWTCFWCALSRDDARHLAPDVTAFAVRLYHGELTC